MGALTAIKGRLSKLVPMLSSNQPGEVVAAAEAISRALKGVGADWHDLTRELTGPAQSAPPRGHRTRTDSGAADSGAGRSGADNSGADTWRAMFAYCQGRPECLSTREQDFMNTLEGWRGMPTEKQLSWLTSIHRRVRRDRGG